MKIYDWENEQSRFISDGYSRCVAVGENLMMTHVELDEGALTARHNLP